MEAWPKEKTKPRQEAVFLPSQEHLVKMIAMQGAEDDEIARMFGVPPEVFQAWKKTYPSFGKALAEGRLAPDAEVTYALYRNAVGFEYEEEAATPKGGIVTLKKKRHGETAAQKYWLENRRHDIWRSSLTTRVTGKDDDTPVGMKVETRNDIIDAIVSLITPKDDGTTKPANTQTDRVKR
jgi:hypothetical protein